MDLEPVNEENFVLYNKKVHLTYTKVHLSEEQIDSVLERYKHLKFVRWSWVHETGKHKDEKEDHDHTHLYIRTQKEMRGTSSNMFDIEGHHCNIRKVKTEQHERNIWTYHQKEEGKGPKFRRETFGDPPKEPGAADLLREGIMGKDIFDVITQKGINIRSVNDIKALQTSVRKRPATEITYTLDDFITKLPYDFETVFITGPAGIGKTQFAKAHFNNALIVSHMDTLKQFNPDEHDGIIFDDMTFAHYPREAVIHLLDWEEDRDIHCRFQNAFIPKETRKIFCSNKSFNDTFGNNMENDEAVTRRISDWLVLTKDLRKAPAQAGTRQPRLRIL